MRSQLYTCSWQSDLKVLFAVISAISSSLLRSRSTTPPTLLRTERSIFWFEFYCQLSSNNSAIYWEWSWPGHCSTPSYALAAHSFMDIVKSGCGNYASGTKRTQIIKSAQIHHPTLTNLRLGAFTVEARTEERQKLVPLLLYRECCSRCRFQSHDCVIIRFVE